MARLYSVKQGHCASHRGAWLVHDAFRAGALSIRLLPSGRRPKELGFAAAIDKDLGASGFG
jgi:hypothetical protein